jgi:hypothetical protein
MTRGNTVFLWMLSFLFYPTFKGCLQCIDISGKILGSEQLFPENCQENQRVMNLPLERGFYEREEGFY